MPKPYIKYKIISSSRSWDICHESVNGRTRWLQNSPLSMSGGIIYLLQVLFFFLIFHLEYGFYNTFYMFTLFRSLNSTPLEILDKKFSFFNSTKIILIHIYSLCVNLFWICWITILLPCYQEHIQTFFYIFKWHNLLNFLTSEWVIIVLVPTQQFSS